jgi:hypothetical protein
MNGFGTFGAHRRGEQGVVGPGHFACVLRLTGDLRAFSALEHEEKSAGI